MTYTTINLLSQSPDTVMTDNKIKKLILTIKSNLLLQLENALLAFFVEKDFAKFDPHVGENSCQIRAHQILIILDEIDISQMSHDILANRIPMIRDLRAKIKEEIDNLGKNIVIKRYQPSDKKAKHTHTLKEFLELNNCVYKLTELEIFLTHSYILSHYKKVNGLGDTSIDYASLQNGLALSKTMAEKLMHEYQVRLAEWSCEFIRQRLKLLPRLRQLENTLNMLECRDDDARAVLPLFLITEILLEDMLRTNKLIMVLVERRHDIHFIDNIWMLFKPNNEGTEYIYCELDANSGDSLLEKPCFFVFGTAVYQAPVQVESQINYIMRFNKVGVVDVLMANMASHPQYSGNKLAKYKNNPYKLLIENTLETDIVEALAHRFNEKHEIAIKYGCSKNDIDLLFIRHILCDLPLKQIGKAKF